ncbi:MAG: peptidoglycan editing factor PgeF [Myxococcota bacterium]
MFAALGRVAHGFSTRHGGVSKGARASLDLADPDEAARMENYRRLFGDAGLVPEQAAWLEQVHGNTVVEVSSPGGPLVPVAQADASFTRLPNLALVVRTADCVPVLLSGPGVVAVAHSGWRGTAVDIVGALVRRLHEEVGVAPADLTAAIGPAIGGDVYEVGSEVVDGLEGAGLAAEDYGRAPSPRSPDDRYLVDLKRAVRTQLERCGVDAIDVSPQCTLQDPAFYSVRRDGAQTGRQIGFVMRRP